MFKLDLEKAEELEIKLTTFVGSQKTVENSSIDGDKRLPYLPPEKSVCRSRSKS